MNRRTFLGTVAAGFLAAPLAADAQQATKVYRVGLISMRTGPVDNPSLEAFRLGLREMGYLEGQNLVLDIGYAGQDMSALPRLAEKFVRLNVDVIVAQSGFAAEHDLLRSAEGTDDDVHSTLGPSPGAGFRGLCAH